MSENKKPVDDSRLGSSHCYPTSDRQFLRLIARQFPDPADVGVRKRILEIAEKVADHTRKEVQESYNQWCRDNGQSPGG